jgi:spore maturation protein CgeB
LLEHNKLTKLLILDGISGVPLGQELYEAISNTGVKSEYADLKKFKTKPLYSLRAAYRKALNKRESADGFYHFPKIKENEFEDFISRTRPSFVLVIGFLYKYLSPDFMLRMQRKYDLKLFLYDTDSCNLYSKRREFIFFLDNELPIYKQIFSFSKITTRFFKETKKLNATFLPFGAKLISASSHSNLSNDVLFVGSCDLRRIFLLEQIKQSVTIFGDRWSRNYPLISETLRTKISDQSVWGDDLTQLLVNSKIVLNITRSHFYGAETGVNLRIFEALAAGCFLLTDYCEELVELFEVGKEIEVFRSSKELVEKVKYYLANPEARMEIARRGHEKYLTMHTWDSRAGILVNEIQK